MHDTDLGSMLNILSTGTHRKPLPSLIKKKKHILQRHYHYLISQLAISLLINPLKRYFVFPPAIVEL